MQRSRRQDRVCNGPTALFLLYPFWDGHNRRFNTAGHHFDNVEHLAYIVRLYLCRRSIRL